MKAGTAVMKHEQAVAHAEVLKALGNPTRLIVVDALSRGDLCVVDLGKRVRVRQPTLSRHLAQLKKAGVVSEYRRGPRVYHHLETRSVLGAITSAQDVLSRRIRKHTTLLQA